MGQHHRRPGADPPHHRPAAPGCRGAPDPAHGLAYPLLLSPSGAKFGKSESGESIWLDPALTSPYRFYQYWLDVDDRDVGTYLRWFTLFDRAQIEELEAGMPRTPRRRGAQRALARDLTERTHGRGAAERVARVSELLFGGDPAAADAQTLADLAAEIPAAPWPEGESADGGPGSTSWTSCSSPARRPRAARHDASSSRAAST